MQPIDRPQNLALKDYLIRKTSVRTMINERTVGDIINFQFQDARAALHDNREVEISAFGKYVFQQAKALREKARLETIRERLLAKEPTDRIAQQLASIAEELAFINSKLPPDDL